jgi:hypothetical protein
VFRQLVKAAKTGTDGTPISVSFEVTEKDLAGYLRGRDLSIPHAQILLRGTAPTGSTLAVNTHAADWAADADDGYVATSLDGHWLASTSDLADTPYVPTLAITTWGSLKTAILAKSFDILFMFDLTE